MFPCSKCNGSSKLSWTDRDGGVYYRCKGTGKQKTAPRAKKVAPDACEHGVSESFRSCLSCRDLGRWSVSGSMTIGISVTDVNGNMTGTRVTVPTLGPVYRGILHEARRYAFSHCAAPKSLRVEGKEVSLS